MKRTSALILTAAMVFTLASCGVPKKQGTTEDHYRLTFSMHTPADTPIGNQFQAMFDDIEEKTNGHVEINLYEWGAFLDSLNAGEHDMFILGWSNGTCDPEHSITPLFHSRNCGASGNRAFLQDDKMDAMIDEACSETDNDKRIQDYKDIQAYLKEVSPWVPLYFKDNMVGRRADLKGFTFDKNTSHYIGNCHYEE